MKKIKIGEKEYSLECNAFTRVLYRQKFNRQIFKDISVLNSFLNESNKIDKKDLTDEEKENEKNQLMLESYDDILDVLSQLTYIEIYTHDRKFMGYEEWLTSMEKLGIEEEWVSVVVTYATECFC